MSWKPYALVLTLALAGCDALTFSSSEEPVTDVDRAPEPLVIDLARTDTVGLFGTRRLSFAFEGRRADRVEVYIAGRLIAEGGETVDVPTAGLADGAYPLRVRAFARSGTGSLGDRLGRERTAVEAEAVAFVDNTPVSETPRPSLHIRDGALSVEWERYARYNFEWYTVERRLVQPRERDRVGWVVVHEAFAPRATTWRDSSYVGGLVEYRVGLRAGGAFNRSEAVRTNYALPEVVEARTLAEGKVRVAWTATPFTAAFRRYTINRLRGFAQSPELVLRTTAPGDTTAVFTAERTSLGGATSYELVTEGRAVARRPTAPWPATEFDVYADLRSPFGEGEGGVRVVRGPRPGTVLGREEDSGRIALYDARTLERLAVASSTFPAPARAIAVSPSGRIAVVTGIDRGAGSVYELDPATLHVVRSVSVTEALGTQQYVEMRRSRVFFTDSGVLVFGSDGYSPAGRPVNLVALDMDSGGAVLERLSTGDGGGPSSERRLPIALSPSGASVITGRSGAFVHYEREEPPGRGYRYLGHLPSEVRDASFVSETEIAALVQNGREPAEAVVLEFPTLDHVRDLGATANGTYGRATITVHEEGRVLVVDPDNDALHVLALSGGGTVIPFSGTPSLAAGTLWSQGRYRRLP